MIGRVQVRPTMSRTFSTKNGSVESLKLASSRAARYLLLFLGFALLLYLRRSSQLLHPQVWDEDGTQVLTGLLDRGLRSLAFPVNGYLITVPKLIAVASLGISGWLFPWVGTAIAWIFVVSVCVAIAVSPTW